MTTAAAGGGGGGDELANGNATGAATAAYASVNGTANPAAYPAAPSPQSALYATGPPQTYMVENVQNIIGNYTKFFKL